MFVRDYMTRDLVTVRPESDPLATAALLKCGGFRRLPVVDTDDRLVGIVDRDDLDLFLAKAGSPGVLKRRHRVDQVMNHEVVTVAPNCPLEEAASLMVGHRIGSLPVMEEGQVVGIITETDIFKQFAEVLGGGTGSLRLTVQVPHVPGQLAELAHRIARVDGNISSIVAHGADRGGRINITLRVEGAGRRKCSMPSQARPGYRCSACGAQRNKGIPADDLTALHHPTPAQAQTHIAPHSTPSVT